MILVVLKSANPNITVLLVVNAFLCLIYTQATISNHGLSRTQAEHVELCNDCKIPDAVKDNANSGNSLLFASLSLEHAPVCNTLTDYKITGIDHQSNAPLGHCSTTFLVLTRPQIYVLNTTPFETIV